MDLTLMLTNVDSTLVSNPYIPAKLIQLFQLVI